MLNTVLIMILSYLAGSIPTSIITGRLLRGIDVRDHGSGNAGGTNAFRVLGWKAGIFVMAVDVFKGFAATYWISRIQMFQPVITMGTLIPILAGVCAILGHTYTVFAGFKGGKGVGTAAGMLIALFPGIVLICVPIFAITIILTGYVSVGSMTAAVSLPILLLIFHFASIREADPYLAIFSILIPIFIIYTHRSNITRLRQGTENRFERVRLFSKRKK